MLEKSKALSRSRAFCILKSPQIRFCGIKDAICFPVLSVELDFCFVFCPAMQPWSISDEHSQRILEKLCLCVFSGRVDALTLRFVGECLFSFIFFLERLVIML